MATPFENFVNTELPKRIGTNESPITPQAGDIPVFTGVGLLTESKTAAEAGLATLSKLTDKADLVDGLVPANQLPSYVDDVLEYADLAAFPATGESGKVYVALDTNKTYRWGGATYVVIGSDLALGETSSTAYRGDRGKTAHDHSQLTGNPHGTTATDLGLGNVDNTSDADKPISTATQTALNGKEPTLANVITANTYGSSTQYPIVTVNAKGIVTGITPQTVPTPTFTDATFAVQKNGSPSISATWSLTAFTTSHVHTYPNKDINFGNMSSVATTDGNSLSGTRNRIVGGSNCTVSGTDNVCIGSIDSGLYGTNNVILGCGASSAYGQPAGNYIGTSAVRSALISCYGCNIGNYATDVVLLNAVGVSGASIANGTTIIGGRVLAVSPPNSVIQGGTFGRPSIRKVESKLYAVFDGTLRTLTENGGATEDSTTLVNAGSGSLTGDAGFAAMHHIRIMGGNGGDVSKRQVMAERIVWVRRRSTGHNYVIEKTYTPTPDINLDGITLDLQIDLAGTSGTLLRIRAADTSGTHGTAGTIMAHVESHYMGI